MAKRFKNFRGSEFDEWEDVRTEDRQNEKSKDKRRKNVRRTKIKEKFRNFKDYTNDE